MGKLIRLIAWSLYRYVTLLQNYYIKKQRKSDEFDSLPKAPYILICNHTNFSDPWFFAQYSINPIGIMVNEDALKGTNFKKFLRTKFVGLYPKKKGAVDHKATKNTIKLLKSGSSVLIFPEGQTSWDGETQPIYAGVERIVKKMKVPLILHNLRGAYLEKPWWANYERKGEVITKRKVIYPDELSKISDDDLRDIIIKYIYNNDIKNELNQELNFYGKNLASGMDRMLWKCPKCGEEDCLTTHNDSVICNSCNEEFQFNAYLKLTVPLKDKNIIDFYDWHQMQLSDCRDKLLLEDEIDIVADTNIHLVKLDDQGRVVTLDTGKLSLTNKRIQFDGADAILEFNLKDISNPVFSEVIYLIFNNEKEEYRFIIEKTALFKWVTYMREAIGYKEAFDRGYF